MKTMKSFLSILAFAGLMTSCLSDEASYRAGFTMIKPSASGLVSNHYANNTADSLVFFSYGNWAIQDGEYGDNSWITIPIRKGYGEAIYGQRVTMTQNTTGKPRLAHVVLVDTDHPSDAKANMLLYQHATRGDGSLGSAVDVKSIVGSDGSQIQLDYDELHRPTLVDIQKDGSQLARLAISYAESDSVMTITDMGSTYEKAYERDFQPYFLSNNVDTVGYFSRYYSSGYPISANLMFNFEHRGMKQNSCVTFRFTDAGAKLDVDSLHNVDTLFYFWKGERIEKLAMTYGADDNRNQSVDVNQLLRGVEECDPYLLASLFRYTRSTSIVTKAVGKKGEDDVEYNVTTQLNADKSVSKLTVANGTQTITYTFNY